MAIVIPGKTRCSICDRVLSEDEGEDWVGLLHCLRSDHPLWRFSNSAAHLHCYEGWKYRGYFDAIRAKWKQIVTARPPLPFPNRDCDSMTPVEREANARFIEQHDYGEESAELRRFLDELDQREGFQIEREH